MLCCIGGILILNRTPHPSTLRTGGIVTIAGGNGAIAIATSAQANKRFLKLSVAKDLDGIEQMILSGELLPIADGTQLKIIDLGLLTSEVRALNGRHSGRSGFIDTEILGKYGED